MFKFKIGLCLPLYDETSPVQFLHHVTHSAKKTRNPCCRKETARCRSCCFQFKVRQRHLLCKFQSSQALKAMQTY